ncbi:YidB family protein [Neoroseomonas soli]|nr:YidB family protein [Neoroseomonas soli]
MSYGKGGGGEALEGLLGMLAGGRGGAEGLGTLVERLRQGGLGDEVDSWVGSGANKPVAPDRLARVFEQGELNAVAQRIGADPAAAAGPGEGGGVAGLLAAVLPQLVNALTPQGHVPQSDAEFGSSGMGGALAQIMGAMAGGQGGGGAAGGGLGTLLGALAGGAGSGGGGSGGGLAALLGGLMGGGEEAPAGKPGMSGDPGQAGPSKQGFGGGTAAPPGKAGLGGDAGGPLPQKPRPLR